MALNKKDIEVITTIFKESFKESIKPLEAKIEKLDKRVSKIDERLVNLEERVFNLELDYIAENIKNVEDIKTEAMVRIGIKKGFFNRQSVVDSSREVKQNPKLDKELDVVSADAMIEAGVKAGQWTKKEIDETMEKIAKYLNIEI